MKVCFLIRAMDRGGAERQLTNLACDLSKQGVEVSVLTFYSGGVLEETLQRAGVSVQCLEKSGRWNVFGTLISLIKAVRKLRPDVLHGYLPTANLLAVLAKPFIGPTKVILGVRASDINLSQYDGVTAWSYRIERFLSRFADGVISNSHAGAKIYKTRVQSRKISVIPNGIDTQLFRPGKGELEPLRENLGLVAGTTLVALVARVDPMKDHKTFLQMAEIVHNQQPGVQFVCIAANIDCSATMDLKQLSRELGIEDGVHWVGPFEDMSRVYPTLDIVVLSSICGEGFPNVIAEAMACGVPCVVTDVGDAAIVVGDSGIVVPVRDSDAMATGVSKLLLRVHEERDVLSSEVRERIFAHFSRAKLLQRSLEFMTKTGSA